MWVKFALSERERVYFTYIGGENAKDGYRVNLGCVERHRALALEISMIDSKALPEIEEPS